jgi:zinc-ribbon domain
VSTPAAECANCGAELLERSHFCPECGTRVADQSGQTAIEEEPLHEDRPAPIDVMWSERRFFGVPPSTALFGLGIGALVLGIVLVATGHLVWALFTFAAALLALAGFVSQTRRLPAQASGVARASVQALDTVKARAGATIDTVAAHGNARIELMRLRRELGYIRDEREQKLYALGVAVYENDDDATSELKEQIGGLDEEIEAKKLEMAQISERAEERIQDAQLSVQSTRIVEPDNGDEGRRPEN